MKPWEDRLPHPELAASLVNVTVRPWRVGVVCVCVQKKKCFFHPPPPLFAVVFFSLKEKFFVSFPPTHALCSVTQIAINKWLASASGPRDEEEVRTLRREVLERHNQVLALKRLYLSPDDPDIALCLENVAVSAPCACVVRALALQVGARRVCSVPSRGQLLLLCGPSHPRWGDAGGDAARCTGCSPRLQPNPLRGAPPARLPSTNCVTTSRR